MLYQLSTLSDIHSISYTSYQLYTVSVVHRISAMLYQLDTTSDIHSISHTPYQVDTMSAIYCISYTPYQFRHRIYCIPYCCYMLYVFCTEMASVTALVLRGIGQTFCILTCDGTCPMSIFQVGFYLLLLLTSIILVDTFFLHSMFTASTCT